MAAIHVRTREGEAHDLPAEPGRSLMRLIRDGGVEELQALCGGCASCGTCHVYVDEAFAALLPPIGDTEEALLDFSSWRTPRSRLSCQVPFTLGMDGLRLTIAPED